MLHQRAGSSDDDSREAWNRARRRKRCFHRIISGCERSGIDRLRFLTLTSSPVSPPDIQNSWRKLVMRLKRRGMVQGYIKVTEHNRAGSLSHLHVLYRGSYIQQAYLSKLWEEIHSAPVVHIKKAYGGRRGVAGYLTKYMVKECERYSWDWNWVYRGFAGVWQRAKARVCHLPPVWRAAGMDFLMRIWRYHLRRFEPPEQLHAILDAFVYNYYRHVRRGGNSSFCSATP